MCKLTSIWGHLIQKRLCSNARTHLKIMIASLIHAYPARCSHCSVSCSQGRSCNWATLTVLGADNKLRPINKALTGWESTPESVTAPARNRPCKRTGKSLTAPSSHFYAQAHVCPSTLKSRMLDKDASPRIVRS